MMTEPQESSGGQGFNSDYVDIQESSSATAAFTIEELEKSPKVEPNAEFSSFIELRNALEIYQKENHVQLIVKDSKLLSAESTQRIIPKVYHLVNKNLIYHSITYCCKCHGELKQKPGTRIKNAGAKRLNCPMYLRFKLTPNFQSLVLFDIHEVHNHGIDPTTYQLPPRQQVYRLSRLKRGQPALDAKPSHTESKMNRRNVDVHTMITTAIKDVNSVSSLSAWDCQPSSKFIRLDKSEESSMENRVKQHCNKKKLSRGRDSNEDEKEDNAKDESLGRDSNEDEKEDNAKDESLGRDLIFEEAAYSPLDSESSCSDSDEEELRTHLRLLPYPVRLIGSAIQSSKELTEATKQLIDIQKDNLILEKRKLMLQTKQLEMENAKLALEVKTMEKNLASEMETPHSQDTTIYLQA